MLVILVDERVVGDPFDDKSDIGAVISKVRFVYQVVNESATKAIL